MSGLKQRLSRRSASGSQDPDADSPASEPASGRLRRLASEKSPKWGKRAESDVALPPASDTGSTAAATEVVEVESAGDASFRDRGKLRRRLRYLRRARELAFRDVGGLIFDLRRFGRERPDLVEAKIAALAAVDQELRALERVLGDRRAIHELREPGLSSCPRCGALHASDDNFCPRCGLQIGGPQAMGEVGGAIAAPPQAPLAPLSPPSLFGPRASDEPPAGVPAPGAPAPGYPRAAGYPPATGYTPATPVAPPHPPAPGAPPMPGQPPASDAAPARGTPPMPGQSPASDAPVDEQLTQIYRPPDAS